ncbi:MAG: DUF664 domain-containing protein [Chloroflexi bacterium]|nr:MAG: DUF664 domain-containing protein [Chloroflexota bacterium]MBL1196853.1 DUF664 domain-containing protein [Chloroflexota bacterium]NOH14149.1 DUF664 domain-containing protein [Chloroflexota bacterium]
MISEVEQYLTMIEDLRAQIADQVRDMSAEALNWKPIEGEGERATNSLAVLAVHVAGAEHFWIGEFVGKLPPTRDRDAEFRTVVDSPQPCLDALEAVGIETREILSKLTPEELDEVREVRGKQVAVRWGILHVIDHTALHLGHMQITYQLWNEGKANPMPRWFERVGAGK